MAVSTATDETSGLFVYDLPERAGSPVRVVEENAVRPVVGLQWDAAGETLYYTRADALLRACEVRRHRPGAPASDDVLVHAERDDRFFLDVTASKDGRYILINANSKAASEVRGPRPFRAPFSRARAAQRQPARCRCG